MTIPSPWEEEERHENYTLFYMINWINNCCRMHEKRKKKHKEKEGLASSRTEQATGV
jgi:hypothetical protein